MTETQQIVILTTILVIIFVPLFLGARVDRIIFRILSWIIFSPYYIIKWCFNRKEVQRRRRNYEILGHYVALLNNNPGTLGYFRNLIEKGIDEKELAHLLDTNVRKLRELGEVSKKEEIQTQMEENSKLKELAAEHEELLYQARLSLEEIKLREKLLDGLYQKIRKKYRL